MSEKLILNEKNVLNLLNEMNKKGVVNVRQYIIDERHLNYLRFKKKLDVVKNKYPEEYKKFLININNDYEEYKEVVKIVLLYMCVLKKYGVELNDGTFRKLDFFDFYVLRSKYFEKFQKKQLIPILEEMLLDNLTSRINIHDVDEVRFWINSANQYYSKCYDSIDLPMSKESILILKDELEMSEKEYIINFMEENDIPFTFGNYRYGVKKMLLQRNTNNNYFDINIYLDDYTKKRIYK